VPGALFQLGGDKTLFRLAAVLQFTSVGMPVIYYGEEVGGPEAIGRRTAATCRGADAPSFPGRACRATRLCEATTSADRDPSGDPALSRGTHEKLAADGDLLVFVQKDTKSDDVVVVAVNRGSSPAVARFALPGLDGWSLKDAWNGVAVPLTSGAIETTLEAKTAKIVVRDVRQ